jgi:actin-like ATPase involved in cell morphogenesis
MSLDGIVEYESLRVAGDAINEAYNIIYEKEKRNIDRRTNSREY